MKILQETLFEFDEYEIGLWLAEDTSTCHRTAKLDQIQRVLTFNLSREERKELVRRLTKEECEHDWQYWQYYHHPHSDKHFRRCKKCNIKEDI